MRKILCIISIIGSLTASAQSLGAFKSKLATPAATNNATVSITEQGDVSSALAKVAHSNQRARIKGYRVCIFFDNGQDARGGAFSSKSLFDTSFSGVKSYVVYESPYYKVTAGNCVTAEEAIILMENIRSIFPKAFLKSEEILLSDLMK